MQPDKKSLEPNLDQIRDFPKAEMVQLTVDNWQTFKDMRLKALQTDPLSFGSTLAEESPLSDEAWKAKLTNLNFPWFFSKIGDKVVAMAGVNFPTRQVIQHRAEINVVYVEPDSRGQGIGEEMMRKLIDMLKSNSKTAKVDLQVRAVSDRAVKMYEKLGFRTVGVYEKNAKIDGVYYDMIAMELIFEDKL